MRGGLSLPRRRLSGTWEPETAMPTEKPQVEATTRARVRKRSLRVGLPIVVKKRGNSRGAKGAGHPRPNQFRSTGNRRNRAVKTEGCQPSMGATSRVTGDSQARFCEGLGVKLPGPTRPGVSGDSNSFLPAKPDLGVN